jgi:hypothetical protein
MTKEWRVWRKKEWIATLGYKLAMTEEGKGHKQNTDCYACSLFLRFAQGLQAHNDTRGEWIATLGYKLAMTEEPRDTHNAMMMQ